MAGNADVGAFWISANDGAVSAVEALRGTATTGRVGAEGRTLGKDPVVARGVRGSSGREPGGAGTANGANSACVPFGIGAVGARGVAFGNPPVPVRGNGTAVGGAEGGRTTVSSIHTGRLVGATEARCAAGASTRVSADFADPSGSTLVALSSDQGSAAGVGAEAAASSQEGTAVCVGMDGRGISFVTLGAGADDGTSTDVESVHGEGAITGADARGRGSGAVVRGSGTGPDGAGGNNPEAAVKGEPFPPAKGEKIGPEARGAFGALGRGVGAAAPFFQVSATEHPPQRSVASGGPATTSGGNGSSHSGHTGVSLTTRACANQPATSR